MLACVWVRQRAVLKGRFNLWSLLLFDVVTLEANSTLLKIQNHGTMLSRLLHRAHFATGNQMQSARNKLCFPLFGSSNYNIMYMWGWCWSVRSWMNKHISQYIKKYLLKMEFCWWKLFLQLKFRPLYIINSSALDLQIWRFGSHLCLCLCLSAQVYLDCSKAKHFVEKT